MLSDAREIQTRNYSILKGACERHTIVQVRLTDESLLMGSVKRIMPGDWSLQTGSDFAVSLTINNVDTIIGSHVIESVVEGWTKPARLPHPEVMTDRRRQVAGDYDRLARATLASGLGLSGAVRISMLDGSSVTGVVSRLDPDSVSEHDGTVFSYQVWVSGYDDCILSSRIASVSEPSAADTKCAAPASLKLLSPVSSLVRSIVDPSLGQHLNLGGEAYLELGELVDQVEDLYQICGSHNHLEQVRALVTARMETLQFSVLGQQEKMAPVQVRYDALGRLLNLLEPPDVGDVSQPSRRIADLDVSAEHLQHELSRLVNEIQGSAVKATLMGAIGQTIHAVSDLASRNGDMLSLPLVTGVAPRDDSAEERFAIQLLRRTALTLATVSRDHEPEAAVEAATRRPLGEVIATMEGWESDRRAKTLDRILTVAGYYPRGITAAPARAG